MRIAKTEHTTPKTWGEIFKPAFLNNLFDGGMMETDMYKKDQTYYININLAGFKKDQIKVSYQEGYLTVQVDKQDDYVDESATYYYKERFYGTYKRSYYIGDGDEKTLKASYTEGVLRITMNKQSEEDYKQNKYINIE